MTFYTSAPTALLDLIYGYQTDLETADTELATHWKEHHCRKLVHSMGTIFHSCVNQRRRECMEQAFAFFRGEQRTMLQVIFLDYSPLRQEYTVSLHMSRWHALESRVHRTMHNMAHELSYFSPLVVTVVLQDALEDLQD